MALLVQAVLLQLLQYKNVILYKESFVVDKYLHIVSEYCEGGDLARIISEARKNKSPMQEAVSVFTCFFASLMVQATIR